MKANLEKANAELQAALSSGGGGGATVVSGDVRGVPHIAISR